MFFKKKAKKHRVLIFTKPRMQSATIFSDFEETLFPRGLLILSTRFYVKCSEKSPPHTREKRPLLAGNVKCKTEAITYG